MRSIILLLVIICSTNSIMGSNVEIDKQLITRIRNSFLDLVKKSSADYHRADVERVKTQDWWVTRFILANNGEEKTLKALNKAMKWRKSFGINNMTDHYFPKELYKIGFPVVFKEDREGRPVFLGQMNRYHKSKDLYDLLFNYIYYNIDKIDQLATQSGFVFVANFTGSTLENIDAEFLLSFFSFNNYYPANIKTAYVIGISESAKPIITGIVNILSLNFVKFINEEEVKKYIDPIFCKT